MLGVAFAIIQWEWTREELEGYWATKYIIWVKWVYVNLNMIYNMFRAVGTQHCS
ncbi:hypothetical protein ACJX0J_020875 [Zea mays]